MLLLIKRTELFDCQAGSDSNKYAVAVFFMRLEMKRQSSHIWMTGCRMKRRQEDKKTRRSSFFSRFVPLLVF